MKIIKFPKHEDAVLKTILVLIHIIPRKLDSEICVHMSVPFDSYDIIADKIISSSIRNTYMYH